MGRIVIDTTTVLTRNQAARYLDIAPNTLTNWVINGRIPHIEIAGIAFFSKTDLDRVNEWSLKQNARKSKRKERSK